MFFNDIGIILKFPPYKHSGLFLGKRIANLIGLQMIRALEVGLGTESGFEPGQQCIVLRQDT